MPNIKGLISRNAKKINNRAKKIAKGVKKQAQNLAQKAKQLCLSFVAISSPDSTQTSLTRRGRMVRPPFLAPSRRVSGSLPVRSH